MARRNLGWHAGQRRLVPGACSLRSEPWFEQTRERGLAPASTQRKLAILRAPGAAPKSDQPSSLPSAISPARGARRWPGEIGFLVHYDVPPACLAIATEKARELGVTADRVLIAKGLVSETHFYRCLARHLRVGFVEGDIALAANVNYRAAIRAGVTPLARGHGADLLAAPRGRAIIALIAAARQTNRVKNLAITTPTHLSNLARAAARVEIANAASLTLQTLDASLCARDGMTKPQLLALTAAACLAAFFAPLAPVETATICTALASFVFLAILWLRLSICAASLAAAAPQASPLADADLPLYSLVVALHREARIVPQLLAAIEALAYPRTKLDVKFVLEDGDDATLAALRRAPPYSEIIIVPAGLPRTKPRALNAALPLVRGELVAVYDAEDIPDPQQLRRAAARFAVAPSRLACLQARLAIDNTGDGWLAHGLMAQTPEGRSHVTLA
ncbi:hypothetical protein CWB41_05960 [Methylovirgula ligni]|nr:hypothetical protein CWB41_05960 [Methylovirgula ligni]